MGALCCMSEGAMAAAIMDSISGQPVAAIEPNNKVIKAIGTGMSLEGSVVLHPFDGTQVLWYTVEVKETRKWKEKEDIRDENGNKTGEREVEKSKETTVFSKEEGSRFLLVDGKNCVEVDIRDAQVSKINSNHQVEHGEYPKGRLNKAMRDWCASYVNKNHRYLKGLHDQENNKKIFEEIRNFECKNGESFHYRRFARWVPAGVKLAVVGVASKAGDQLTLSACSLTSDVDKSAWSNTAQKAWERETKQGAVFVSLSDVEINTISIEEPQMSAAKSPDCPDLQDEKCPPSNHDLQKGVEAVGNAIGGALKKLF